jgi:hypothetical protein
MLIRKLLFLFILASTQAQAAEDSKEAFIADFIKSIRDTIKNANICYPFDSEDFKSLSKNKLTGSLPKNASFQKVDSFRFTFLYNSKASASIDRLTDSDEIVLVDCAVATQIYYLAAILNSLGDEVFDWTILALAKKGRCLSLGFPLSQDNALDIFFLDTNEDDALEPGEFVYCADCPLYHRLYETGFGQGINAIVTTVAEIPLFSVIGFTDELPLFEIRQEIFRHLREGPPFRYRNKKDKDFKSYCKQKQINPLEMDLFVQGITDRNKINWQLISELSDASSFEEVEQIFDRYLAEK